MSSPKKRAASPIKTGHCRDVDLEYTKRISLLRKTTGIREEDVEEFQKTEILRQSIATVKERAAKQENIRLSPRKYQTVKSKVAGNMKSQKRAKVRQYKQQVAAEDEKRTLAYIMGDGKVERGSQSPVAHYRLSESPTTKARASQIQQKMDELNGLAYELEQKRNQAKQRASAYVSSTSPLKNASNYSSHADYRESQQNANAQQNNYQTYENCSNIMISEDKKQSEGIQQYNASCSPFKKQKAQNSMKVQSENSGPVEQQSSTTNACSGYVYFEESRAQKLSKRGDDTQSQYTANNEDEISNVAYSQQSDFRGSRRMSNNSSSPTKYVSPYKQTKVKKTVKRTMVSSQVPDEAPMPVQLSQNKSISPHKRPQSSNSPTKYRKSTSPVKKSAKKPSSRQGQMNYFEPQEPVYQQQEVYSQQLRQESEPELIQSQDEYVSPSKDRVNVQVSNTLLMGQNKFRNPELEAKSAQLEAEFQRVLNQESGARVSEETRQIIADDDFYKVMGNFYGHNMKKHESPTRRLRQLKDTTVEHKTLIKQNYHPGQEYSLVYCSSPQKSYVIEPKGGELNYNLAHKNPNKFYSQVINQEITQHKVRRNKAMREENKRVAAEQRRAGSPVRKVHKHVPLEFTTKITRRKIGKVLDAVNVKLHTLLINKMGKQMSTEVEEAMKDSAVQKKIDQAVKQRRISLVDQNRNHLFIDEMAHIADHGTREAAMISPAKERPSLSNIEHLQMPEANADPNLTPSKAELACDDLAFDEVHNEVLKVIKRRSTLKDQQLDF